MKISALLAAQVFRELAGRLPYPLGLQLVTDEEVGGRDGTRHQLERGVRSQFVIIGETSGLRIVTESKGIVSATLQASGRSAHSAYQWLGDNALVKLERSVARCRRTRRRGAGDGRFYGELGITAVAFGVDGSGQHGPDEYADITTIAPYHQALTEFLLTLGS